MFDHTQSETYRPHPHTYSVTGSALLAAAVPAVCWAINYPLTTALFVGASAGVRTLRSRGVDADATDPRAVEAAESR
ncbi:hypothetical protein [Haloplanus natans]|uniref:hypothetical protein n=1 Tax=Haloplanus natans TaxID=376171 RepID=UPI000677F88B|nr:hypothetical protein [Haloplanus natans]